MNSRVSIIISSSKFLLSLDYLFQVDTCSYVMCIINGDLLKSQNRVGINNYFLTLKILIMTELKEIHSVNSNTIKKLNDKQLGNVKGGSGIDFVVVW